MLPFKQVFVVLADFRSLSLLTAALLTTSLAQAAPSAVAESRRPAMPALQLPAAVRGAAAIEALGRQLPAVAAHYRMSPERLAALLRQDPHAWLDTRGRVFFVDAFLPPLAAGTATGSSATEPAPLDLRQTFLLHSRPGARRVIYLDFDGHAATNTAWTSSTITAAPFDTDGNPLAFSEAEQARIQYIWQRVAEDYAPFDVDVTTEAPPPEALRRSSSTDAYFGTRVVITRNTFYSCNCGGVAYLGVYDWYSASNPDYYQPAWVFYDALGSSEKYIAEAASHEAGHNLGLAHDGNASSGYYSGHGSGATGWAPIMGASYYKEVSQWSRGEYPGASNAEDDLALIPANGVPLRVDAVGDSLATAAPLNGSVNGASISVTQRGVIERRSDVDVYRFASGAGPVAFTLAPASRGTNLDIAANLYNASGALVASHAPADSLAAALNLSLPAGTYYLSIGGSGAGDLVSGYSDYGSLGQYRISGSYPAVGAQAPVAVAAATPASGPAPLTVSFTGSGSSDPDGSIAAYRWEFGDGASASTANPLYTYTAAGSYSAVLTVTDTQGLTHSRAVAIAVSAAPALTTLHVEDISLSLATRKGGYYQCVATVRVHDGADRPLSGVSVSGRWSGTVSQTGSATTGPTGSASFKTAWTRKRGTCTFTVSGLALPGYSHAPAEDAEIMDSLSY